MKHLILIMGSLVLAASLLAGCDRDDKETTLKETFTEYGITFKLPKGWQKDEFGRLGMDVYGGYGYGSPDYAGLTYLRLHQGRAIAIIGDWEPETDAASVLETSFARDISDVEPISVLGADGTYAHGVIDQGQGIGAVHIMIEVGGERRQVIVIGTIADKWEVFEPTFKAIVKSLNLAG